MGRGAGEVRVEVGVDLALNALSKRNYEAEVGEVEVKQVSHTVDAGKHTCDGVEDLRACNWP
jgi:hypothetical protein